MILARNGVKAIYSFGEMSSGFTFWVKCKDFQTVRCDASRGREIGFSWVSVFYNLGVPHLTAGRALRTSLPLIPTLISFASELLRRCFMP
ncbi:MAG: hypothetical protein IJP62_08340 [Treponema sp.]|nr:hypothetical protein [Treponema sp.]